MRSMSIAQKRTLDRALAGERRFGDLFEGAIEGIYRTDCEGRFRDANPALAELFGFARPGGSSSACSRSDIRARAWPIPATSIKVF